MHPITSSRQQFIAKHPPYGLFLDPHSGRHSWTAVNPVLLLGAVAVIGGLAGILAFIAR